MMRTRFVKSATRTEWARSFSVAPPPDERPKSDGPSMADRASAPFLMALSGIDPHRVGRERRERGAHNWVEWG